MAFQQFPQKGGIPSGNTAGRPSSPVIGDTYYNGQLEILEIFNGTTWVASSAPPATPSIVSVTDVGTGLAYGTGGSLSVVFSPGSGGGTPNQYNAYTTAGGFYASAASSTVVISGLTSNTSFTVYGTAQNNFGTTVNTANFAPVLATTVPNVPTIGTAQNKFGDGQVLVAFTAPSNNGGKAVTNYQYSIDGGTTYTAFSPAQTTSPLLIGGLTNGTAYTIKLKAVNANGVSAASGASNSVTPTFGASIDFLVAAGGGGGGGGWANPSNRQGGGGGGGGFRTSIGTSGRNSSAESPISITLGSNYTVTVGAGGNVGGGAGSLGSNGSNSVFSTITSSGGGGGGYSTDGPGQNGGCGGGGGSQYGSAGSGTSAQGFEGVIGQGSNAGGGGGGAGSTGSGTGGGSRITASINSTAYCGGGTGVATNAGGNTPAANSGDGGAGTYESSSGSNGGSGIVVLKYPDAITINIGSGLTGSEGSPSGGYKIATITSGSGNVSWS